MASGDPSTYKLTVRPHRRDEDRFEYVLSSPGSDPLISDEPYETYEAAKEAGHRHGRALGLNPSPSVANE